MLNLWTLEEGACYISKQSRDYVAWSLLCYSSKMFWGCEMIKELDRAKSLSDRAFGNEPNIFPELFDLLKNIESPLIDTVRIGICFENYFKAVLLIENYVIHWMDRDVCKGKYPQFLAGNQLLQKSTPILIEDVKKAESHDINWSTKPLESLTKYTIDISKLLKEPKYQMIYSKGKEIDDELFSLLVRLNKNRNNLHFLNIEYIASGGLGIDKFVFLRDYVSTHIDAYAEKFYKENEGSINAGKFEIDTLDPEDSSLEEL